MNESNDPPQPPVSAVQGRWTVEKRDCPDDWILKDDRGGILASFDNPDEPHLIWAAHNASLKDDKKDLGTKEADVNAVHPPKAATEPI